MQLVLQILSTAVLARILSPGDFGLLAMVMPLVGFAAVFADAGLSMATVQRVEISHRQVSNLFWFNVMLGVLLALLVVMASPVVAWFYSEPSLAPLTILLALPLVLTGLSVQHKALLTRQMRFGTLAWITIASQAVSIGVGVAFAAWGAGYWSLGIMHVANAAALMVLIWSAAGWVPGLPRRGAGTGAMLAFGGNMAAFSFINFFVRNLDNILIGAVWGKSALGLYSRAYNLLLLPITQLNGPVGRVAVPALSRLQQEPERFAAYYRKGLLLLAAMGMPLVAFCAVATDDVVLAVLGAKWVDAVPIFRALAPAAFCGTFNVALGWVFVPLGQVNRQVRVAVFSAAANISAFFIGLRWGPVGVAYGFSIAITLTQIPMLLYTYRRSPLCLKDWASSVRLPALASMAAAFCLWLALPRLAGLGLFLRLLLSGAGFYGVYAILFYGFARLMRVPLHLKLGEVKAFLGR
jgi:O-antigen/teichoic acid export membrane protein